MRYRLLFGGGTRNWTEDHGFADHRLNHLAMPPPKNAPFLALLLPYLQNKQFVSGTIIDVLCLHDNSKSLFFEKMTGFVRENKRKISRLCDVVNLACKLYFEKMLCFTEQFVVVLQKMVKSRSTCCEPLARLHESILIAWQLHCRIRKVNFSLVKKRVIWESK